jgi:hypothetical protein
MKPLDRKGREYLQCLGRLSSNGLPATDRSAVLWAKRRIENYEKERITRSKPGSSFKLGWWAAIHGLRDYAETIKHDTCSLTSCRMALEYATVMMAVELLKCLWKTRTVREQHHGSGDLDD